MINGKFKITESAGKRWGLFVGAILIIPPWFYLPVVPVRLEVA